MLQDILNWFSLVGSEFAHIGTKEIGLIVAIIIMDAALSGDNSIAIGALAQNLPTKERNKAVWIGMSLAAVLRLVALSLASFIMTNPWVQVLGGLYLIYLCYGHFVGEGGDKEHKAKASLISVLIAIGFLDLSLSLDNVIAVVAMTSNLAVIFIGVMISIAMLAVATKVTQFFMKRYPSLEPAAYVILAFLGVIMLVEHTSEFIVWTYEKFHSTAPAFIHKLHLDVGETWEIIGVGFIVFTAIVVDEFRKRKDKALLHSITIKPV